MQVNIASRDAAAIPAAIDNLAEFSGVYATVFLPAADGQAPRPVELTISSSKSGARLPLFTRAPAMLTDSKKPSYHSACDKLVRNHVHYNVGCT